MAIDTTIQYNGRNSYKVTDMLWQWPYHVTDMTHITHSFRAMCDIAQGSGVRAKTKFIDSTGGQISEVTHSFTLPLTWEIREITVSVPVGAAMAILGFVKGSRSWWVAEPKTEQGETATPFNVNYQGQLSFMTPTGLYTGFIRANQILVTGSPSQPGEQLEQRLVTINQNAINLSSTVSSKTTNITHEGVYTGKVEAYQLDVTKLSSIASDLGSITGGSINIKDKFKVNASGDVVANSFSSSHATITGGSFNVTTGSETFDAITMQYAEWKNSFSPLEVELINSNDDAKLIVQASGLFFYRGSERCTLTFNTLATPPAYGLTISNVDITNYAETKTLHVHNKLTATTRESMLLHTEKNMQLTSEKNVLIFADEDLQLALAEAGGNVAIADHSIIRGYFSASGNSWIRSGNGKHYMGVDNTGPYFIIDGGKIYI